MISCYGERRGIQSPLADYQRTANLNFRTFWYQYDIEPLSQAAALDRIEKFVIQAVDTIEPAWVLKTHASGIQAWTMTSTGRRLSQSLPYLILFDAHHDYTEHVYAFLDACWLVENIWGVNLFHVSLMPPDLQARHAEALNCLVEKIRMSAGFDWFKRGPHDRSYEAKDRTKRIERYTAELLQSRSKLMLVRTDFSYHSQSAIDVTIDAVYADLDELLHQMRRNETFRNLLGYAIAIEQGHEKGFHIHCLFFFDGSQERLDIAKGAALGRLWCYGITRGRGIYHNSNAWQHTYEDNGIGMISRSDPQACANAVRFARYLTKDPHAEGVRDPQYLRMKPANRNQFWCGHGPDLTSTVGRPAMAPTPWSLDDVCLYRHP